LLAYWYPFFVLCPFFSPSVKSPFKKAPFDEIPPLFSVFMIFHSPSDILAQNLEPQSPVFLIGAIAVKILFLKVFKFSFL